MERKRAIWFGLALLVVAGGLSWYISRSREPRYEGKPLTYWLECLVTPSANSATEAEHAIQAIGTNAIPTLLEMYQKTDSPLKMRLSALLEKQRLVRVQMYSAGHYYILARRGFEIVGSENRQTIPTLINIFKHSRSHSCRMSVLEALIGLGAQAENAVPTLASSLAASREPNEKCMIINDLMAIHAHPEISVPAMMNCLADSNSNVVTRAVVALAIFGELEQAKKAVPGIEQKLRECKDPGLQQLISFELRQIDAKAAAQAQSETNHAGSPR